jgi:lipid-binding SYLF domain-containing protein
VGYFVSRVSATKIPLVGAGYGIGVLIDKETGSHTYMNISRADLGAGLGASKFRVLILFENREVLQQFRSGIWKSGLGAESAAGTQHTGRYSVTGEGYSVRPVFR